MLILSTIGMPPRNKHWDISSEIITVSTGNAFADKDVQTA